VTEATVPDLTPAPSALTPSSQAPLTSVIETAKARVADRLFALKDGDTFVVADSFGDIYGDRDGLFHNDTRILSVFKLSLADEAPSLLSAAISSDNVFFVSHLTNRPLPPLGGRSIPEGVIHLERSRYLWTECLYERIEFMNYGDREAVVPLALDFAADFRDMFEVRGQLRPARGRMLPPEIANGQVIFRYEGLDRVLRSAVLSFSRPASRLTAHRAEFLLPLTAAGSCELFIEIGAEGAGRLTRPRYREAAARARRSMRARLRRGARPRSSARLFNEWMEKSRADLALLTSELPTGPYPYAGIPWFSTAFGRDAIITALETLWLDASLARGVLRFLARHQATETSPFQDSAPGKIMHETRKGEMTSLRELPFGQYYGGVDTTPLFVMLAGAYAERTGDLAFTDELWPALLAAINWVERVADAHPDGFVAYARAQESGLANQAWKDSEDSIFHADGRFPAGPLAVIEVQGYAFSAMQTMASLAERRGEAMAAMHWRLRAENLRAAIESRFWIEDLGFYGIAQDGERALCRVRASNAGHLLYVGLPRPERAQRVSQQLQSTQFNSGWGLRTLATDQAHFNPMSYHNGSVWPHDTAVCAAGLARYNERDGVARLTDEMFESAVHFGMRLPELFCGFPRAAGEPPIAYPVACLPQAWAAGAAFMLMQACLGLRVDGWRREIIVDRPVLPSGIDRLHIESLDVGGQRMDLRFQRVDDRVVAYGKPRSAATVPVLVYT
jgi:glycogen debranching enzyme